MICPNCKNQVAEGTVICPNCGMSFNQPVRELVNQNVVPQSNNQNIQQPQQPVREPVNQNVVPQSNNHNIQQPQQPVRELVNQNVVPQSNNQNIQQPQQPVRELVNQNAVPQSNPQNIQQPQQPVRELVNQNAVPQSNPQNIQQSQQPVRELVNQNAVPQSNNKSKLKLIIILIIAAALIAVAVIFIMGRLEKKDSNLENNNEVNQDASVDEYENDEGIDDYNSYIIEEGEIINESYDENGPLLIAIEDVFSTTGLHGRTIIVGPILRGVVNLNDDVEIIGLGHETLTARVTDITSNNESLSSAKKGDSVGIRLDGVVREQIEAGQVLAKPNTAKTSKKFEATINILSTADGGRHTSFSTNFESKFGFNSVMSPGTIKLSSEVKEVNPGDYGVNVTVELDKDTFFEVGTHFTIFESDYIIGNGIVTKVY